MDWLSEREIAIYNSVFMMSGETGRLDKFVNRFAWFKQRQEEMKGQWAIFPDAWRVPQTLALTFCKITKAQVGGRKAKRLARPEAPLPAFL